MKSFKDYFSELDHGNPLVGDNIAIELSEDCLLETYVTDIIDDGIVIQVDRQALSLLESHGYNLEEIARYGAVGNGPGTGYAVAEDDSKHFKSALADMLKKAGMAEDAPYQPEKDADHNDPLMAKSIDDAPIGAMDEAEYHGREVPLGKPMAGDVKKSKVYVKGPNGNVVKVNFGDPNMRIKKNSPSHRKSFRARHNCDNPGPRWKARYWSCRAW
jgi:hypothetical protein